MSGWRHSWKYDAKSADVFGRRHTYLTDFARQLPCSCHSTLLALCAVHATGMALLCANGGGTGSREQPSLLMGQTAWSWLGRPHKPHSRTSSSDSAGASFERFAG